MLYKLEQFCVDITFNINAILMAIFVGWADVFYTAYIWGNMVVNYNSATKHFWRSLCWHEDNFEGWTYYYYLL